MFTHKNKSLMLMVTSNKATHEIKWKAGRDFHPLR